MNKEQKRKFGPWSKEDREYIAANANTLSVEEIADEINRSPETVSKYIRKTLGLRIKEQNDIPILSTGINLESSLIWGELEQEFTKDELKTFLYHWNRILVQFKEDVFPTEEMQIIDAIKLEIMMGRASKLQKECLDNIKSVQGELNKLKNQIDIPMDGSIERLETQLIGQKSAYTLADKEFNELLTRKSAILKELKGTRDQRLKRIEDSKTTFVGWMSQLLTDVQLRKDLGIYLEKNRLASLAEEQRLSQIYKFADGEEDLPLLSSEVLEKLEQEAEKDAI